MCLEWLTTYVCKPPADKPWDILGWSDVIADEEYADWKENQLKELNNGRLAMVGIIGLIAQTALTGNYGQWGPPTGGYDIPDDWGTYVLPGRVLVDRGPAQVQNHVVGLGELPHRHQIEQNRF